MRDVKKDNEYYEDIKKYLEAEIITELEADKAYRDIGYAIELIEERREEFEEVMQIAKETRDSDWDDYNSAISI